ncbi:TPA: N-6 DNA methylase, partial [Streptococcus suis]|nr:N-6 DNA methylase [Streptococcus suis]
MAHVLTDNEEKYQQFVDAVNDLHSDWLQMIYQYWLADRDIKKQDYTPKTIAKLVSRLALQKTNEAIVDICAGSGALVIQS